MQHHFQKLKNNLEPAQTHIDLISVKHTAVRDYLKNNHPVSPNSKLIGSLQRRTRIHPGNGSLDIDILIVMGEFHNWVSVGGISPVDALFSVHNTMQNSGRYGTMNPQQDSPTVTITHADGTPVELVPAYLDMIGVSPSGENIGNPGRGYWVPKNGQWIMADYDYEADQITRKNELTGGRLIPMIKMLKAIKNIHFPQLGSFPLEILASDIILTSVILRQIDNRPLTDKDLLLDFFIDAPLKLNNPLKIEGSKSAAILLTQKGVNTQELAIKFKQIVNHINAIDNLSSNVEKINAWRTLFGNYFPIVLT